MLASFSQAFSTPSMSLATEPIYSVVEGSEESQNKILIVDVEGVILNEEPRDPFLSILSSGVTYGYSVKDQLIRAANDSTIKGVVLYVNSPGGTITGSAAIADGVEYYKSATGNPVIGFGSGLVASGGYWAISATDKIYLDQGSSIGSIGVILGPIERYRNVVSNETVATLDGITEEYITSGKGKDLGNPYRDLTEEERNVLQNGVNDAYNQFVELVSVSRGISSEEIKNNIAAYIYGDNQALSLKLIDQISNREELFSIFTEELGISSDYQIVRESAEGDFFSALFSATYGMTNQEIKSVCSNLSGSALVLESSFAKNCLSK